MTAMMWSKQQRLVFIETRLYWEGQLNRRDIEVFFKISAPQASGDLKQYMKIAPGNMVYDKSLKAFLLLDTFQPKLISTDPYEYFNMLLLKQNERFSDQIFLSSPPPVAMIGFPRRQVDGAVLRSLLRAMKQGLAIEIHYQSMTDPDPHWRWITPHSLVSDGFRWHLRCFCHRRKTFRDFVLGRILATAATREDATTGEDDLLWNTYLEIEIAPHETLSPTQRIAVEFDYEMQDGVRRFQIRAALLFYLRRLLQIESQNKRPRIHWKNEADINQQESELQKQAQNDYAIEEKQEV